MEAKMEKEYIKGGEFLIDESGTAEIFTPEDFTDEQRMIGETTREFVDNEVQPNLPAMEKHAWEVARELVKKGRRAGAAGRDDSRGIRRAWRSTRRRAWSSPR